MLQKEEAINLSEGMGLKVSQPLSSSLCPPFLFCDSFAPVVGVYSLALKDVGRANDDFLEWRALELELDLAGNLDAPL